jgi:PEP-CTERM motif
LWNIVRRRLGKRASDRVATGPGGSSDAWISFDPTSGKLVGRFSFIEKDEAAGGFFTNTGITVTDKTGTAVELLENDDEASDYIYAVAGFLYFSSDDENGNIPIHPAIPGGVAGLNIVASLNETGNWQEITPYFTFVTAGTKAWVASDVPEPSTWAMMLVGFAGLAFGGFRARKRMAAVAL